MDPPFFTINACNRCRKRKARCDTQIPACQPCQSSGSICKYTDARSGDIHPRSYIHDLEAQLASLESQIEDIKNLSIEASPVISTLHSDTEAAQGCTPVGTNTHATFIPPSSGIHLVRSVIESAQQNPSNFESPSESADIQPSNDTKIALPSREIANNLLETFFSQYQVQYPILDQEEFTKDVSTFYDTLDGEASVSNPPPGDVGSEIAHKLHTTHDHINKSHETETEFELSPWTEQMAQALKDWNKVAQTLADPNGYNVNWWGYWYRTALLILYRPSPLRPHPSESDTLSCYTAAKELIQLSFLRISEGVAEFTWVDLNFQFMSGITIILIIWKSPTAREIAKDDWVSLKSSMFQWKLILERLGMRWERISRAREALSKLADVTMDLVEKDLTRTAGGMIQPPPLQNTGETRRFQRRSIIQQLHGLSQPRSSQTTDQQDATLTRFDTTPESNTGLLGESTSNSQDQTLTIGNVRGLTTQSVGQSWTTFNTTTISHQESSLSEIPPMNDATDELWPLFDLSDITTIPDELNLWTYFSGPMLNAGDVVTANFNCAGRPDESLTNSILNFQGDLSSLTPDMSLESSEESDYMQGFWAGQ
ncbi:hypothetical protein FGRMN_5563 [Fusarium graminum]|nr:hypothetical protein FGRMN_5563 [Fusarium graminum]